MSSPLGGETDVRGLRSARGRVQPRYPVHRDPHHGRRSRRLSRRTRSVPPGRGARLPMGEPRDHRASTPRTGRRSVHWLLRADPRRAQLDLRPRPRGRGPRAEDPAAAGRLLHALPRLPQGHHGARDRRRSDGRGRDQRLRADDARPLHRVGRTPPARRAAAVPRAAAGRDRRGRQAHLHRGEQRRVPLRLRRLPSRLRRGLRPACSPRWTG